MGPRIMPGLVVSAYVRTGLHPARGRWYDDGRANALTAIALMSNRVTMEQLIVSDPQQIEDAVIGGLGYAGYSYLIGFCAGFDGSRSARFYRGSQDGEAAWEAVVRAELVK